MRVPPFTRLCRADVLGLIAFFAVGMVLTWLISDIVDGHTAAAAERQARFASSVVVSNELEASDVTAPSWGAERKRLDRSLATAVEGEIVGVRVRRFDGTVVASVGTTAVGPSTDPRSMMMRAFEGRVVTETIAQPSSRTLVASYIPLDGGNTASLDAVVEVYLDRARLAAPLVAMERGLIAVTLAGLAILYLSLLKAWRSEYSQPDRATEPTGFTASEPAVLSHN